MPKRSCFAKVPLVANRSSAEQRSWNMSRIRGKDTKPERLVRSCLHGLGYRFTVNGPKNQSLPGKPDIVLPKLRTAVFVHGCFWHQHADCREGREPGTNVSYWGPKLARTAARDAENENKLRDLGWRVTTLWECEIERAQRFGGLAEFLLYKMAPQKSESAPDPGRFYLEKVAESPPRYGGAKSARRKKTG